MGRMGAEAMAEATDIVTALGWHLSSNHYPPIPSSMIEPALAAIQSANWGDWDKLIDLPDGVTFKNSTQAPVHELVDSMHLESWIDREEF